MGANSANESIAAVRVWESMLEEKERLKLQAKWGNPKP